MALVSLSTRTALQRQFEVLADLLFPVDNNLGEVLKDLGRQFEDNAKATILYLNRALKDVPRTRNESKVNGPIVAASKTTQFENTFTVVTISRKTKYHDWWNF
ncbi:hypothetical protein CBS147321_10687 [Aspergillus niger]|nr:hypothetical protein CBS147321_10687 [Aspergillus niger]